MNANIGENCLNENISAGRAWTFWNLHPLLARKALRGERLTREERRQIRVGAHFSAGESRELEHLERLADKLQSAAFIGALWWFFLLVFCLGGLVRPQDNWRVLLAVIGGGLALVAVAALGSSLAGRRLRRRLRRRALAVYDPGAATSLPDETLAEFESLLEISVDIEEAFGDWPAEKYFCLRCQRILLYSLPEKPDGDSEEEADDSPARCAFCASEGPMVCLGIAGSAYDNCESILSKRIIFANLSAYWYHLPLVEPPAGIYYLKNLLSPGAFHTLRARVQWDAFSPAQARLALRHTLWSVLAMDGERPVAMGRVVGDFSAYLSIVDVAVDPEYQNRGVGSEVVKRLFEQIEEFMRHKDIARVCVDLVCGPGEERFYARFGFTAMQCSEESAARSMRRILTR